MPTFQSKPRLITANRFHTDTSHDVVGVCRCGGQPPHLHTMHAGQVVQLADGDWVVAEPDGEHYYPIKDAVIQTNYDRIKENAEHGSQQ